MQQFPLLMAVTMASNVMADAEKAEKAVKEAADAINQQLPKEAQGGSLQPLVEEREEGESQPLDTFSSEIDSFDTVHSSCL